MRMIGPNLKIILTKLVVACLAAGLSLTRAVWAQDRPAPRILVLNSYHHGFVWTDLVLSGIESVFESDGALAKLYVEFMDARRLKRPEYLEALFQLYREKFRDLRFDVVIVSDNRAFEFLLRHRDELFPATPAVFCGVGGLEEYDIPLNNWLTGIVEATDTEATVELVLKLHSDAKQFVAITDSQRTFEAVKRQLSHSDGRRGLDLVHLDPQKLTLTEILARLKGTPSGAVGFLEAFFRERLDETYPGENTARLITGACSFPVYGVNSNVLGKGIVGGKLNDGYAHGVEAAKRALQIVRGAKPGDLPIQRDSSNRYMFDYRQLQRWGIDKSALPADSLIVHQPDSIYARYKGIIWTAIAFMLLQSGVISVLAYNIARRKKAEASLRESESSLERAQKVANVGSWDYDLKNNKLWWSTETFRIFGYQNTSVSISREFFYERVHPEDRHKVLAASEEAKNKGTPLVVEHRILRPDGSERLVEQRAEVVTNAAGDAVRLIGTVRDVTDRRRLEEQLRQSQKMDAIGKLAGGVAHDFNNLLTAITGYSELTLARLSPEDTLRPDIEEIKRAGDKAAALTRQLLAFSRKQLLKPEVLSLNAIVAEMNSMLTRIIGEDIQLTTHLGADLGMVKADRTQIEQVILNLAVNARDAMPRGGNLTIETSNAMLDENFLSSQEGVGPGPYVMLAVTDNGCGMDEATRARIFEPFFTTKEAGKGTGLGLSTVYGIVKQSGGTIWVHSEERKGSSFKVYLPSVNGKAPLGQSELAAQQAQPGAETILLVEDEAVVRSFVRNVLDRHGHKVLEAANPNQALDIARAYLAPIHLMVTDVVMPEMSGKELADLLAVERPEMKVLFVSGHTEGAIVQHGVVDEHITFLQKPFTVERLVGTVRAVLDQGDPT
ncbi:MAG: ATP-binding protein [Acidobacteriota bacterium]